LKGFDGLGVDPEWSIEGAEKDGRFERIASMQLRCKGLATSLKSTLQLRSAQLSAERTQYEFVPCESRCYLFVTRENPVLVLECHKSEQAERAECLDLLLVSAGGDIGDNGGRATGHLNSQFMIVLQKHDRANISKRQGGKISKN
jgi:hypothetical protein